MKKYLDRHKNDPCKLFVTLFGCRLYESLSQACQTHFGIRAKFFENRIQNFFTM